MAMVERSMPASREAVFAVLADGWSYSDWVVGTVHIRSVDGHWPQPGAVLHHKVGAWPISLHDRTVSVRYEPPELLVLSAHLWPLGQATVTLRLRAEGPDRTVVTLDEDFERGPMQWLRNKANDVALHYRNRESLRRLEDLAIRRTEPGDRPNLRAAVSRGGHQ